MSEGYEVPLSYRGDRHVLNVIIRTLVIRNSLFPPARTAKSIACEGSRVRTSCTKLLNLLTQKNTQGKVGLSCIKTEKQQGSISTVVYFTATSYLPMFVGDFHLCLFGLQ